MSSYLLHVCLCVGHSPYSIHPCTIHYTLSAIYIHAHLLLQQIAYAPFDLGIIFSLRSFFAAHASSSIVYYVCEIA
ncbi:hypothetical protein EON63_16370 [archaeon]|nr:MAG: hypothetical protein EON63_16370 [archaeon]